MSSTTTLGRMECRECHVEMLAGQTGLVCPNGHGKIVPWTAELRGVYRQELIDINPNCCKECGGTGRVTCWKCDGIGEETCPECGHDHDCDVCDGERTVECEACEGTGIVTQSDS